MKFFVETHEPLRPYAIPLDGTDLRSTMQFGWGRTGKERLCMGIIGIRSMMERYEAG